MWEKIKGKRSFGMNHFDEDTILKFVLEVLDDDELKKVRDHLIDCEICNTKFNDIKKQNELIGSYNPDVENKFMPIYKKKNNYSVWIKRAAVLLMGFLLGYSASVILYPNQVVVVEQYLISKSPQAISTNFTECPNIDIYRNGLDL